MTESKVSQPLGVSVSSMSFCSVSYRAEHPANSLRKPSLFIIKTRVEDNVKVEGR